RTPPARTAGPGELALRIPVANIGGHILTRLQWFVVEEEAGWIGLEVAQRELVRRVAERAIFAASGWTRVWWGSATSRGGGSRAGPARLALEHGATSGWASAAPGSASCPAT